MSRRRSSGVPAVIRFPPPAANGQAGPRPRFQTRFPLAKRRPGCCRGAPRRRWPVPPPAPTPEQQAAPTGKPRDAMDGAAREAEARGYHVVRIDDPVIGEARITAPSHLRAVAARIAGVGRPVCVVSTGETTVRVTGRGKGGRNQEFALAAAELLASLGVPAVVASIGTDGVAGPTGAAGAGGAAAPPAPAGADGGAAP